MITKVIDVLKKRYILLAICFFKCPLLCFLFGVWKKGYKMLFLPFVYKVRLFLLADYFLTMITTNNNNLVGSLSLSLPNVDTYFLACWLISPHYPLIVFSSSSPSIAFGLFRFLGLSEMSLSMQRVLLSWAPKGRNCTCTEEEKSQPEELTLTCKVQLVK